MNNTYSYGMQATCVTLRVLICIIVIILRSAAAAAHDTPPS